MRQKNEPKVSAQCSCRTQYIPSPRIGLCSQMKPPKLDKLVTLQCREFITHLTRIGLEIPITINVSTNGVVNQFFSIFLWFQISYDLLHKVIKPLHNGCSSKSHKALEHDKMYTWQKHTQSSHRCRKRFLRFFNVFYFSNVFLFLKKTFIKI